MSAIIKAIRTILRIGTGTSFLVLIGAVVVQVAGRSFIGSSAVWTEELTRFALLYLAGFGTGLALFTGDLVNVDLISEALPGKLPWLLRLISAMIILVFCLLLIVPAWRFTSIGALQTSPAMAASMIYIHASVLLLLTALGIVAILRIVGMLTGSTGGKPEQLIGGSE